MTRDDVLQYLFDCNDEDIDELLDLRRSRADALELFETIKNLCTPVVIKLLVNGKMVETSFGDVKWENGGVTIVGCPTEQEAVVPRGKLLIDEEEFRKLCIFAESRECSDCPCWRDVCDGSCANIICQHFTGTRPFDENGDE